MTEERKKYIKEWKRKNKDKCREHFRKWYLAGGKEKLKQKRLDRPEVYLASLAKSENKFPEKRRARIILSRAVRSKKVFKKPCQVCEDRNSFAHHHDYSKPLDVIWLCTKHHFAIHKPL